MTRTVVSTMKNEGPYLLEWLAYHTSIGVERFVIFSNDCTDGTNLILDRLDAMGIIHHFDNPQGPNMDPQRSAYSRANRIDIVKDSDWVLVIDADEFLNVHTGDRSIGALIESVPDADAISVNWRLMGSNGKARINFDALVTERFTSGSNFEKPENGLVWGFKTLFRPEKFDYFGVHRPKFKKHKTLTEGMVNWVNGDGKDMGERILSKGWRSSGQNLGYSLAQVNHYAVKSREDFLLKRLRGTANSKNKDRIDMEYWSKFDINSQTDQSIPTQNIRSVMEDWLKDIDLAALVRASQDSARRVLEYQLTVKEFSDFVQTGTFEAEAKD